VLVLQYAVVKGRRNTQI